MHGLVILDDGRRGDPSLADLVRPAQPGAGGRRQRQARPRERAAVHRQPGADRLHPAQAAVGARQRAAQFRARAQDAAAEGLRALPADRRVRHRSLGRLRHGGVRRGEPALVVRDDGRRSGSTARFCRGATNRAMSPARSRREVAELTGLAAGTPVVGGGGDQASSAVGNGIVEAGIVSCTLGTSGVVFAHMEKVAYDPAGPRPHVLPRGARQVARDGRDAGRGPEPAMVPQPTGARRRTTTR